MTVTVRPAGPADAASACTVLRRSIAEVCGPDYASLDGFVEDWLTNKTPENVATWIANPALYFAVACTGDPEEIVGAACVARSGEILLCYVIPEYLGQGCGRALLADLTQTARAWGLDRLATSSTTTARAFYVRQGFTPSGSPVIQDGQPIEIPMTKSLA